jgi:hypothetical protein
MVADLLSLARMRVLGKPRISARTSLDAGDLEDWLDRQIASLRRLAEYEEQPVESGAGDTARVSQWWSRGGAAMHAQAGRWLLQAALRLAVISRSVVRRTRARSSAIAFYGFGIAIAVVIGWLIGQG